MDVKQAREIIKNNYPPENYTMLREALDWLLEQAEKVQELRNDTRTLNQEIGSYSTFVSDIAELNEKLAKHTRLLSKKMIGE